MTAAEELARAARMAVDAMEHTEYFSDRTDPDKPHLVVDRLSTALARFEREAPVREIEMGIVDCLAELDPWDNVIGLRYLRAKLLAARVAAGEGEGASAVKVTARAPHEEKTDGGHK